MRHLVLTFLVLAPIGLLRPTTARAEARPAPELAPANAPKSEFTWRTGFSKDPFFPKSQDVPPPVVRQTTTVPTTASVPDYIRLGGISHVPGRKPLAIVNNYTVGEGEEFNLKRGNKTVTVRCIEIKEQSIVVSVDGATKEINLRLK